jgi:hypothetical protein
VLPGTNCEKNAASEQEMSYNSTLTALTQVPQDEVENHRGVSRGEVAGPPQDPQKLVHGFTGPLWPGALLLLGQHV